MQISTETHAKIIVGVAIKSGRGNVKGSGIRSPPPTCAYSLSNSTQKEAVSKKNSILISNPPKIHKFTFHIQKSVFLAFGLSWISLKAFALLRLQRKSHSSPEKCFFYLMKNAFTVFGVTSIRKILFHLEVSEDIL